MLTIILSKLNLQVGEGKILDLIQEEEAVVLVVILLI